MERTLEIMMEELRLAKEERKPLSEAIEVINKKIRKLDNEIEAYKLNNGLYHPMSELANYKGKDISHIILVERDKDGALDIEYMYNDEIFEVTDNGHLYYSSYSGGITQYREEDGKYYHHYYGHSTPHEYVGFLEIELEDDED